MPITAALKRGDIVYSVILGDKETGAESDDLNEILEVLQTHLNAAEQSGANLKLELSIA